MADQKKKKEEILEAEFYRLLPALVFCQIFPPNYAFIDRGDSASKDRAREQISRVQFEALVVGLYRLMEGGNGNIQMSAFSGKHGQNDRRMNGNANGAPNPTYESWRDGYNELTKRPVKATVFILRNEVIGHNMERSSHRDNHAHLSAIPGRNFPESTAEIIEFADEVLFMLLELIHIFGVGRYANGPRRENFEHAKKPYRESFKMLFGDP